MVGEARFELATSCTQNRRSTRLSHSPKQILSCQEADCKYLVGLGRVNTGAEAPLTVWSHLEESNLIAHRQVFYRHLILPGIYSDGILIPLYFLSKVDAVYAHNIRRYYIYFVIASQNK